jgi:hypothetical protein
VSGANCRCGGTGKLSHDSGWIEYPNPGVEGEYVSGSRSLTSSLCPCRRDLPPREGTARWWASENVFSEVWQASVYEDVAEITVQAEVPISEDNYRVVMRGNRYYPTAVDVQFTNRDDDSHELRWLFPEEARELARLLVAAADKCDEIDQPCVREDGTWWEPAA